MYPEVFVFDVALMVLDYVTVMLLDCFGDSLLVWGLFVNGQWRMCKKRRVPEAARSLPEGYPEANRFRETWVPEATGSSPEG